MKMDPLLTKTVSVGQDTYKISVRYDEYVDDSPRDWDNLGVMACAHKRYKLGDDKNKVGYDFGSQLAVEGSWDEMEEWIKIHQDPVVIKSIYMMDHSGVTLSTSPFSCPWDSGRVGFIYVTSESVKKAYNIEFITPEIIVKAVEALDVEVSIYNRYLQGDVYGYTIEHNGTELESCWGYYTTVEEVMTEAESVLTAISRKSA